MFPYNEKMKKLETMREMLKFRQQDVTTAEAQIESTRYFLHNLETLLGCARSKLLELEREIKQLEKLS
jgi:hypothetical protein